MEFDQWQRSVDQGGVPGFPTLNEDPPPIQETANQLQPCAQHSQSGNVELRCSECDTYLCVVGDRVYPCPSCLANAFCKGYSEGHTVGWKVALEAIRDAVSEHIKEEA